jgi:hypothetical protein
MIQWIKKAVMAEFVSQTNSGIIVQASTADEVVQSLKEYRIVEGRMHLDWSRD